MAELDVNFLTEIGAGQLRVDPVLAATPTGGGLRLEFASGATETAEYTVPAPGVVRMRIGRPPVEGTQIVAVGTPLDVAEFDRRSFPRSPGWRSLTGSTPGFGRLLRDGRRVGWLETAALLPAEELYGGGESFQGPRLRGRRRDLVNRETHGADGLDRAYVNAPFFWSTAGWGIYANTANRAFADLGATHSEIAAVAIPGDEVDLCYFAGSGSEILRQLWRVTGAPATLPDWAFGVWSGRCSYVTEAQIHDRLDDYAAADCPVHVVHVDAWMTGDVMTELSCNWQPDERRFPAGWIDRLRERNVRTSLWLNPYVIADSPLGKDLASLLVRDKAGELARTPDQDNRAIVDFTNPAAVAWWQERVAELIARGAAALKCDFAEEIPDDAVFFDGRTGVELHNEYALLYQQITREAMGAGDVAQFNRSGTVGAQRYPGHWVGDTPSTWDGLVSALRGCLSLSLSGFSLVGHDIGGFWVAGSDEFRPIFADLEHYDGREVSADVEPELFARWTQWGALSPLMRFHGTGRREPTAYPEPARSVAIAACRLRERLMPYLARSAAESLPLMRPTALTDPDEVSADLQYLLGPDILVAPILRPGGSRRLWVPPGEWLPLVGLDPVSGPGWVNVDCGLDQFPAWLRAGTTVRSGACGAEPEETVEAMLR